MALTLSTIYSLQKTGNIKSGAILAKEMPEKKASCFDQTIPNHGPTGSIEHSTSLVGNTRQLLITSIEKVTSCCHGTASGMLRYAGRERVSMI